MFWHLVICLLRNAYNCRGRRMIGLIVMEFAGKEPIEKLSLSGS